MTGRTGTAGRQTAVGPSRFAVSYSNQRTFVAGDVRERADAVRSTPNSTFTVQLFSDPSADPSGLGEGQQLLGTVTVTTDANGIADFKITLPEVPGGQILTATATDTNGNTSAFSLPVEVRGGQDDQ